MRVLRYIIVVVLAAVAAIAAPTAANAAPTWYSGTIAPGASGTFTWNNANPLNVSYEVGLSPMFATMEAPCEFEVMRAWYVQNYPSLERQFKITIKNIGTISCGTFIILREMPTVAGSSWYTPVLKPGITSTHTWNNAGSSTAHVPGLVPMGANATAPCQMEIIRRWDVLHFDEAGGVEREFKFTVANVGAITCKAAILLGTATTNSPLQHPYLAPGQVSTHTWNNANPVDKVYALGIKPSHTQAGFSCDMEAQRKWYVQRADIYGNLEREFWYTIKNVGNLLCGPNALLT